ncbi:MAG: acyl-CoA dehydrogenase family protein [Ilumatobacteraceae bacterium]
MGDSFDDEVERFFARLDDVLAAAGAGHVARARAWRRALWEAGLAGFGVPEEYGGRSEPADGARRLQRLARGRVPHEESTFGIGLNMAVPTILQYGSEELKKRFVPAALSGEEIWCQLYSEPGAGSDLPSLAARAVPDGDEWVVNGQKVWTSGAQNADLGIMLVRTGDDPGKAGITMMVMPMHQLGVEVRPLRQITGDAEFNEVFFTDARGPRDWVVGEVNDGWRSATQLLAHERSSLGAGSDDGERKASGSAALPFHFLRSLAVSNGRAADPLVRQELARAYSGEMVMAWLSRRRGVHPSIGKLWRTRQARHCASVVARLQPSLAAHEDSADDRFWRYHFLNSPRMSIGGGTDEIQRNTLGERALGLPREPGSAG